MTATPSGLCCGRFTGPITKATSASAPQRVHRRIAPELPDFTPVAQQVARASPQLERMKPLGPATRTRARQVGGTLSQPRWRRPPRVSFIAAVRVLPELTPVVALRRTLVAGVGSGAEKQRQDGRRRGEEEAEACAGDGARGRGGAQAPGFHQVAGLFATVSVLFSSPETD